MNNMTKYRWQGSYQAAVLETDWTKMLERIQTAESEIHKRRLVFPKTTAELRKKEKLWSMPCTVLKLDAISLTTNH
jgi:hypothetical protein